MTNLNRRGSLSVTSIEATTSFDSVFTDEVSYTYPATYIQQRTMHVFECPMAMHGGLCFREPVNIMLVSSLKILNAVSSMQFLYGM